MQSAAAVAPLSSAPVSCLLVRPSRPGLTPVRGGRSLRLASAAPFCAEYFQIQARSTGRCHGSGASWVSAPSLASDRKQRRREKGGLTVRASSVPESTGGGSDKAAAPGGDLLQTLLLGSLFGLWYLFNIYFNIYNKQV
ncbi:hypothetical protein BHM03_00001921 [Ensete ventricosum]|nr:hypothetical protein BHM03_00001921 [Ensete ventricosum]